MFLYLVAKLHYADLLLPLKVLKSTSMRIMDSKRSVLLELLVVVLVCIPLIELDNRCLARSKKLEQYHRKVMVDVNRSIFEKCILLDMHSIEYFFTGNISSYLISTIVLMSSHHIANSGVHRIKARWL